MNAGYNRVVGIVIVMLAGLITAPGAEPVYSVLHRFASGVDDGLSPLDANVVADASGNLYGTTLMGGIGWGTVYTIRNDGSGFRVIHPFDPNANLLHQSDGGSPNATLLLVGDTLYGTAVDYGRFGGGTVFKVGTDGTGFEVLHAFAGPDGRQPFGSLVIGPNETLYGPTWSGGTSDLGTVFCVSVSPQGTSCPQATRFSVLHSFGGAAADDGAKPVGLVLNGTTLYGATDMGGTSDVGTIYSISTSGSAYFVMHRFDSEDGEYPLGALVQDASGILYGTTTGPWGTVFRIGPSGDGFSVLKQFRNESTDGDQPRGQLALYGNSTLYGTTMFGGLHAGGTVFTLQTDGSGFSFVYHFADFADGVHPRASVIVDNTGALYGTTQSGGSADPNDPDHNGVLFKLTGIIVDTTPPSVSCTPPPIVGWRSTDVIVPCTASDSGSGLANPSDSSFSLSTHVFPDSETVVAETDGRSICDFAGNCVPAGPYGPFMIDRRPPAIFLSQPGQGAVFVLGDAIAASYSCDDLQGSGVASCTGSVATGSLIDTATPGAKTFTINASDQVGNSSSLTVTYTVVAALTPSAITVVAQPNPSIIGQSVTVTATVTGSAPTGTVNFYVDGFPEPGSFSLQATSGTTATASTSIVLSTIGSHDLSARYFGDALNAPSVSAALPHQVVIDDSSGTATKAMATNLPDDLKGGFTQDSEAKVGSAGPSADVRAHLLGFPGPNTTLVSGQVGLGNASVAGDAAAARGVTYRTYTNTTNEPLLQARADVSGMFLGSAGRVIATVYVFDASVFLNTVRNSGKTLPEFLLGTPVDTLASYASASQSALSLANLFPTSALLGSASRILLPANYIESSKARVETTVPVAPGQAIIYVSDFIAYDATPGTLLSFGQLLDIGRPDIAYSVSASPASLALLRSSAKSSTITLRSTNGVSDGVQLAGAWIGFAPSGVTFAISPTNVTVPTNPTSGALATLNVAASASAEVGLFTLRLTATSASGVTRTIDMLVLVSEAFAAPTCGCTKTGAFEDPRVVGLVRQSALATVTVSADRLTLTRDSDNRTIVNDVDGVSEFGFSPNGKYFVLLASQSTLTGPVFSLTLYSVPAGRAVGAATTLNPLSWGFSPDADNRFFVVTSSESLPTYVDVQIFNTQTETRVMQTALSNYSSTGQPPKWTDENDVKGNDGATNDNDKVGGWGFSPDGNTFVLSYKISSNFYDFSLWNLTRGPVKGETRSDVASFWQFSPCGDLFMLVSQKGPNPTTSDTVDFIYTSNGIVYEEVNLDPAAGGPSATAVVTANSTFEIQLSGMSEASIKSPQCSTSVSIHSPANIVLVDSTGRRTGFNPVTGGVLNEIPGGTYTGVGSEPQTVTVPYGREAYLLIAYGLDSLSSPAPYSLTFATIDAAGDAFDLTDVSAMAFRGSVDGYAFSTGDGPITPIRSESPDTVPPEIHCAGADGQWHPSDVVLVCSASDSQSGLVNPADGSFSLSTHVATGTETVNASTDSRQVCDNAGNCATAGPISGNKVDKKGPSIVITSPTGTYALGQTVPATYSCADAGSGIATCAGTVANGANINTASEGTKTFAVTATDAVGNKTEAAITYGVVVKGAADQIRDLIALVKSLGLASGITNNLVSKLQSALDLVNSGKSGACGKLKDFIDTVNAQTGKGITQTQAAALIESATRIRAVLGCP